MSIEGTEPKPPTDKPPAAYTHETVQAAYLSMMGAAYGHGWQWKLSREQRRECRRIFFAGFQAAMGNIVSAARPILGKQLLPRELSASLLLWQNEIQAFVDHMVKEGNK